MAIPTSLVELMTTREERILSDDHQLDVAERDCFRPGGMPTWQRAGRPPPRRPPRLDKALGVRPLRLFRNLTSRDDGGRVYLSFTSQT
ncbi:hypothetical protein EVAR_18722_1 [Eumeta japonica]|uniref:Uncharacterized protein n=1 Tax=Eumeta variegata TaxID=151549 RepID=A0A4C1UMH8_EUMVA|nr:hypothetical protein EVAR_18722_1 [Eumeta japonica]